MMTKRTPLAIAAALVLGFALPATSQAGDFGFSINLGGWRGHHHHRPHFRRGRIYHPLSVHYDRVYHHEYSHWTPRRGWHSHGHYDYVPHFVPGHFDRIHRNHVHYNRRYHH